MNALRRSSCFARRIHQAYGAEIPITATHDHRRMPALTKLLDGLRHGLRKRSDAIGAKHFGLANENLLTIDQSGNPASRQAIKLAGGGHCVVTNVRLAIPGDSLRQRMVAEAFNRDGYRHQFFFRHA